MSKYTVEQTLKEFEAILHKLGRDLDTERNDFNLKEMGRKLRNKLPEYERALAEIHTHWTED
jgi:hypothetical protein